MWIHSDGECLHMSIILNFTTLVPGMTISPSLINVPHIY